MVSLNLANGAVYWKFNTSAPIGESSPTYSNGIVYIGNLEGWLNAVNASDGKKLWAFKAGSEIKSSAVVVGDRWEVCGNNRFEGRCVVLRPGRYPSLAAMGLNDRVSSVRAVNRQARIDDNRYAPQATPVYDSRRRKGERVFEADVTAVRAVVAQQQQRCWG